MDSIWYKWTVECLYYSLHKPEKNKSSLIILSESFPGVLDYLKRNNYSDTDIISVVRGAVV